jgi:hypothetical protein
VDRLVLGQVLERTEPFLRGIDMSHSGHNAFRTGSTLE